MQIVAYDVVTFISGMAVGVLLGALLWHHVGKWLKPDDKEPEE